MKRGVNRCQSGLHSVLAVIACAGLIFLCNTSTVAAQQPLTKAEESAVAAAKKAASTNLSMAIEQLRFVAISPAEWRDSSLGCPERGKVYTPALTAGYKVTLRESDREVLVHVAGGRGVVCDTKADPRVSSAPIVQASLAAGDAVRAAISRELKVAIESVRIVSVRPARAGDPCTPEKVSGAASIVDARVGEKSLRYFRDDAMVRSCGQR